MEFGLEKCAKIAFKRGKQRHQQNLVTDINKEIQELEQGKTYKYLGIEENEGIHQQMREIFKQEYSRKSKLNARNKITTTGALAVPVLNIQFWYN